MTNAAPHPAKTVLICEDDANLRTLVRLALGNGYRYVEAADAAGALEQLGQEHPDLIVLDLMLPGRSGFELLQEIRRTEAADGIPVVVISAWAHSDEAAVAAGADMFVSKPFDPDALRETVTDLLADDADRG